MENIEINTKFEPVAKRTEVESKSVPEGYIENPIGYYTDKAMDIFSIFEIDGRYSDKGIRKNVSVWYENKTALMNLFRKHPAWDEEAKAIVFKSDEIRPISFGSAMCNLETLIDFLWSHRVGHTTKTMLYAVRRGLEMVSTTLTQEAINTIINYCQFYEVEIPQHILSTMRVGVKFTKLVNKICSEAVDVNGTVVDATKIEEKHPEGARNYRSYQKLFAKFADCLSELRIKKITLVSLNFNDFMTMSNGNSWSSCHFINSNNIFHDSSVSSYRGQYKQGCLSYALDDCSFIFYTLPSDYDGAEYYKQKKINRMVCQYKSGVLVTGKCYPNNEDELITTYRQTMQYVISECEGFANSWTFSRDVNKIGMFVETAYNSAHYRDYTYDGQKPTISIHKPLEIDDIDNLTITIGHSAYCLECGNELNGNDSEWLQCERHREDRVCAHCGCVLDEDDCHEVDGEYYCDDCCFYCDEHKQYETGEGYTEIINGHEMTVCEYALDNYTYCERCGEYHSSSCVTYIDGKYICDDCRDENYYCCEVCGSWVKNGETCACKTLAKAIGHKIVKKNEYQVGDYVLIKVGNKDTAHLGYTCRMRGYEGKIVKIERVASGNLYTGYKVSNLYGGNWIWCNEWFVGAVVGADDSMIGKDYKEVVNNGSNL